MRTSCSSSVVSNSCSVPRFSLCASREKTVYNDSVHLKTTDYAQGKPREYLSGVISAVHRRMKLLCLTMRQLWVYFPLRFSQAIPYNIHMWTQQTAYSDHTHDTLQKVKCIILALLMCMYTGCVVLYISASNTSLQIKEYTRNLLLEVAHMKVS